MTSPDHLAQALAGASATVVEVRPGDTLIVSLNDRLTEAEIDYMQGRLAEVVPEGVKVAIFDVGVDVTVVRPDGGP